MITCFLYGVIFKIAKKDLGAMNLVQIIIYSLFWLPFLVECFRDELNKGEEDE